MEAWLVSEEGPRKWEGTCCEIWRAAYNSQREQENRCNRVIAKQPLKELYVGVSLPFNEATREKVSFGVLRSVSHAKPYD